MNSFIKDTLEGLTANPKHLSSQYFYDTKGSKIFQDIMRMPEYYLTDCEMEIFTNQKQAIIEDFGLNGKHIELIELGAGDGLKTKILLSHLLKNNVDFKYLPIDISEKAVHNLVNDLKHQIPELQVTGLVGDYFKVIKSLNGKNRKILLFLGSNIGNFEEEKAISFLNHLKSVMNNGDMLLIGFDLKKEPQIILDAYNDAQGYTEAFNLNLLQRINDELGGDFDLSQFTHEEIYDEHTGTAQSYLKSKRKQSVHIKQINKIIEFKNDETIFMEISQKYDLSMIENLAQKSGFNIVRNYYDERQYFINSLWTLKN